MLHIVKLSNSFPRIGQHVLSNCNSFPRIRQSVLSNCNSFPRIGQIVLSDCNSFPRIGQLVISDCNSFPRIRQSVLSNWVVQFEGTNCSPRERVVQSVGTNYSSVRTDCTIRYNDLLITFFENPTVPSGLSSYESPEGTWGFSKKAISKSLYRIVQSVFKD